jgi:hypothetical protein
MRGDLPAFILEPAFDDLLTESGCLTAPGGRQTINADT